MHSKNTYDSIQSGKEEWTLSFTYRHKKEIIIATTITIIVLLSVIGGFVLLKSKPINQKTNKSIILHSPKKSKTKPTESNEEYYQVDIKGEINNPGIYSVKKDSRVIDVIRLAGDLTENADTKVLNLSKKVTDEMVIIVYSYEEVKNFSETKKKEELENDACKNSNDLNNGACIESNQTSSLQQEKISINTASKEELMLLTGIGESKALAIIKYRKEKGEFKSIEELKEVEGIGESLFAKIKEDITL